MRRRLATVAFAVAAALAPIRASFVERHYSSAAYLRLDDMKRAVEIDDEYGHLWVRSVIGLSL